MFCQNITHNKKFCSIFKFPTTLLYAISRNIWPLSTAAGVSQYVHTACKCCWIILTAVSTVNGHSLQFSKISNQFFPAAKANKITFKRIKYKVIYNIKWYTVISTRLEIGKTRYSVEARHLFRDFRILLTHRRSLSVPANRQCVGI